MEDILENNASTVEIKAYNKQWPNFAFGKYLSAELVDWLIPNSITSKKK
jgi:hypothetical protein